MHQSKVDEDSREYNFGDITENIEILSICTVIQILKYYIKYEKSIPIVLFGKHVSCSVYSLFVRKTWKNILLQVHNLIVNMTWNQKIVKSE